MANDYLQRIPTSTGNQRVCTISAWVKYNGFTTGGHTIFSSGRTTTSPSDIRNQIDLVWNSSSVLQLEQYGFDVAGGSLTNYYARNLNKRFRDYSGWMHILVQYDSTLSSAQDRAKIFVNGIREDMSSTSNNFAQDYRLPIGVLTDNVGIRIGRGVGALQYGSNYWNGLLCDYFFVDGQSLSPEVFGFNKNNKGYISAGVSPNNATDIRNGQWVPKKPSIIIQEINSGGGFGVNGFYLPLNDSSNFGADFHCTPNSIITLKGENLPQPRNGAPTTTNSYVSQLRTDPFKDYLVLAVAGASTASGANLIKNGTFDSDITDWTAVDATLTWSDGRAQTNRTGGSGYTAYQAITTEVGKRYTISGTIESTGTGQRQDIRVLDNLATSGGNILANISGTNTKVVQNSSSFTATGTTTYVYFVSDNGGTGFFDNIVVRQENVPRDYSADIKGSGTNKTLTANGNAGVGYNIPSYYGSALSFDGSDDYFSVPNTADLRMGSDDFTVEAWFNANDFTGGNGIVGLWNYTGGINRRSWLLYTGSSNDANFIVSSNGTSAGQVIVSSGNNILTTNQWNHIVGEKEGTTIRLYVNGVVVGISTVAPSSLYENTDDTIKIGTWDAGSTEETNGYIQDLRVYKGVAKYTSGFDVPKIFTPVNITSWRAVTDTPQNNFATIDKNIPFDTSYASDATTTLSDGLLTSVKSVASSNETLLSSMPLPSSGKWYWEVYLRSIGSSGPGMGIASGTEKSTFGVSIGQFNRPYISVTSYQDTVTAYNFGYLVKIKYHLFPVRISVKDVVGFAMDYTGTGTFIIYINGVKYATVTEFLPTANAAGYDLKFPYLQPEGGSNSYTAYFNFGQNSTFSGNFTTGTYTDASGRGLFRYQPPAGHNAICEENMPAPSIQNPGKYFKTALWTGNLSSRNITGIGFKPDLVWTKSRDSAYSHVINDVVRGVGQDLFTDLGNSEASSTTRITTFDSDGFSIGNVQSVNNSGEKHVAWCWKAGDTIEQNISGTILSDVCANNISGFSIVSWTGIGGAGTQTIGHGLNKKPKFIIIKNRTNGDTNWAVHHSNLTSPSYYLLLNSTVAEQNYTSTFISPSTSTFTIAADSSLLNTTSSKYIAYCWTEIEGFSKINIYKGTGTNDGGYVNCGFKPAWVIVKRIASDGAGWTIFDSARSPTNPVETFLSAGANTTEATNGTTLKLDFLSNGFKIRNSDSWSNTSDTSYIYMAFAESPFNYSNSK